MNGNNAAFWAVMAALLAVGGFLSYVVIEYPDPDRDQDQDGFPDPKDAFPLDPREWADTDGDGVGDNADREPFDDADGDGYPDGEDVFPGDPDEWQDSDRNGVGDNAEFWPLDSDGDGFGDVIDLYPNKDMGIYLNVTAVGIADEVDLLEDDGEVFLALRIDGQDHGRLDNLGETWTCAVGSSVEVNESYRFNVDDNRRYTSFEITMYEDDVLRNDVMDIDGTSRDGRTLSVAFDMMNGTWRGNDLGGVADGSLDGTAGADDNDGSVRFGLQAAPIDENREYSWSFGGKNYRMEAIVPPRAYAEYGRADVPRSYYYGYTDEDVQNFVTSDDAIVASIANELKNISAREGFDDVQTINFALRFCQSLGYSYDNATMDADEYWRFPVETLYDETGDCEDTSFLFASIAEAMGFDAVIFMLPGHAAVGVASDGASGSFIAEHGVLYYYCETTSPGFELGELPYELEGEEVDVVQVS